MKSVHVLTIQTSPVKINREFQPYVWIACGPTRWSNDFKWHFCRNSFSSKGQRKHVMRLQLSSQTLHTDEVLILLNGSWRSVISTISRVVLKEGISLEVMLSLWSQPDHLSTYLDCSTHEASVQCSDSVCVSRVASSFVWSTMEQMSLEERVAWLLRWASVKPEERMRIFPDTDKTQI